MVPGNLHLVFNMLARLVPFKEMEGKWETFTVTGNLPQLNDPTMISVGTVVMVMLLLQYSQ